MGFVPFNNVVRTELFITQDSQRVENVLHWQLSSTPTDTNMSALAANIVSWWNSGIKPISPTNLQLNEVKCTSLNSQTAPVVEYTTGLPIIGTSGNTPMPNNVTVAIRLLTALRGRSYRGRIYHIGTTSNNVSANTILTAYQTALTSVYNALTIPAGFGGAELVVASRVSGGVERTIGVATPVTSVSVNRIVDSQRRRLPERGL